MSKHSNDDNFTPDVTDISGAYALNAVNPAERDAFEATLPNAQSTLNEVTELKDTAVLLGLAVDPVVPSAGLKLNLMAQIAQTPQLSPVVAPVASIRPDVTRFSTPTETKAQSRWFSRTVLTMTSVAAAAALLIGGGVLVNSVVVPAQQQAAAEQELNAIKAAEDSQQAVAEVAGGGTATLVWSNQQASAALIVDGLAPLPDDKVYELWYIGESGPRAAGTFTVDESGETWRVLEGDMQAGDLVGVTIEPKGGSEQPTTDPIVGIQA
ncbi:anti-sigma factor [Glaciihabitans arcticus]|uniref:Regulator of SigK n=1 Tax=Glaciihabitans arcticus TaxID=2668039 RepID=A0A4Q9GSN0_9MICO|nr:anti-sigma factor [Glaciihabitans arcticus]TBN57671.1 anti-sigma factor [Glaciihabitans arcticus]